MLETTQHNGLITHLNSSRYKELPNTRKLVGLISFDLEGEANQW